MVKLIVSWKGFDRGCGGLNEVLSRYSLGESAKNESTSVRIAVVPAKIRTGDLPSARLDTLCIRKPPHPPAMTSAKRAI
jgi:hypothetical protein